MVVIFHQALALALSLHPKPSQWGNRVGGPADPTSPGGRPTSSRTALYTTTESRPYTRDTFALSGGSVGRHRGSPLISLLYAFPDSSLAVMKV